MITTVIRRAFSALIVAASVSFSTFAAAEHPAQELVVDGVNQMLDILRTEGEALEKDPALLQSKIDEIIVPRLDFNTMTKLAVGKFWRQADADQKTELVTEFRRFLMNTYTSTLNEYSGEGISFDPFRPESREDRAVVKSTFIQSGGSDVPVLYKLREKGGWSVYDIEVNNISLVTSYRTAFASEIRKGGIDGLLETLKKKNTRS